jgi:hypothetical protein
MVKATGIMMTMIRRVLIAVPLFAFAYSAFGQNDDFGIWLGIDIRHQIIKNLDVTLAGCMRTFNKTSQVEQYFVEGGLQYKFTKNLSTAVSYRLVNTLEDNSSYYFRHKLFLDLKGSLPVNKFDLSLRIRMQRTTRTYIEDSKDLDSEYAGRVKLKAEYNLSSFPVVPYLYMESFSPVFSGSRLSMSKTRYSAGAQLKITRNSSIEAEYIFQRDFQPKISNEHIVSLNYKIKF